MTTPQIPDPIKDITELKAALQLAVGLELSTIPVYLTALYSIKDGHNADAAQTIRSVVMEEMLHMTLAANVLNALGQPPSTSPVTFRSHQDVKPVPEYPHNNPLVSGIGDLALLPLTPEAVSSFVKIEHPFHGAASLRGIRSGKDSYPTIGLFYEAITTALDTLCTDDDFTPTNQVPSTRYYGGAGQVIEVSTKEHALAAIHKIIDEGEGLPPDQLEKEAKKVTTEDKLNNGWQMYSHYARFREIQVGRRFRSDQKAEEPPMGSLLLVDYDAVHPAVYVQRNGDAPGGPEGVALNQFDLAYTRLVDDLYLAFSGKKKKIEYRRNGETVVDYKDPLLLAVHGMWALKEKAVALMRTPDPAHPARRLCPRFHYAATADEQKKLKKEIELMRTGAST
ncbi:ferritin-like protein [Streptomyces sp. R28]|uniref:Ferritin-like protein n=1 Tax=Streptomyces sp. R28 TaxID=3238628 RepID=A0AB39PZY4_9ACTN